METKKFIVTVVIPHSADADSICSEVIEDALHNYSDETEWCAFEARELVEE